MVAGVDDGRGHLDVKLRGRANENQVEIVHRHEFSVVVERKSGAKALGCRLGTRPASTADGDKIDAWRGDKGWRKRYRSPTCPYDPGSNRVRRHFFKF
jgi:hypothetical protein